MLKRIFCVLLVLSVAAAMCACGGNGSEPEKKADALVGSWQTNVDIADRLNSIMGMDELVDEFTMKVSLVFENDGTMTMTFDREHLKEMQKKMAEDMWQVILGMNAEDTGMEISEVEEMLEASGFTSETLLNSMNPDGLLAQFEDRAFYWLLDGDRLYIDQENAENADPIQIELSGDQFSMVSGDGIKALLEGVISEDRMENLLPIVFERTS